MNRLGLVITAAVIGACSFPKPQEATDTDASQPEADGRVDGAVADGPRPDGQTACKPGFVDLCNATARADSLVVSTGSTTDIDTSNDSRCVVRTQSGGPDICVLFFDKVDIQATGTLTVHGTRALALAAKTTFMVAGTLDAGARRNPQRASPGASNCTFGSAPENDAGGGGGGAGGTFAIVGGGGGIGDLNDSGGGDGIAAGGTPGATIALPTLLRGGCSGQKAGTAANNNGGIGGGGGGAVYLFAKGALEIAGNVFVTGAGGSGGGNLRGGGGGGGSGGFLVIESETSSKLSGLLLASGGGGGEGGDINDAGQSGGESRTLAASAGGAATMGGGNGGNGATWLDAAAVLPTIGLNADGGGGGGGGGNGYILIRGTGREHIGMAAPAPLMP